MRRLILIGLFLLASCGGANSTTATVEQAAFRITINPIGNSAVDTGANPLSLEGCWGANYPITWYDPPANTQSFAVVLHGPKDAQHPDFTWGLIYNIPASDRTIIANSSMVNHPNGAVDLQMDYNGTVGRSSINTATILGPCAQRIDETVPVTLTVYALDLAPTLEAKLNPEQFATAIQSHVITKAERKLEFTYLDIGFR